MTEVKSNNNGTSSTSRGQQLSTDWLRHHLGTMFPGDHAKINDIIFEAERVLVNYESVRAGDISMHLVDDFGNSTNRKFNP